MKERLPVGLACAAGVAAVSLGVLLAMWWLRWPVDRGPELMVHGAAGLCLLWATLAAVASRRGMRVQGKNQGQATEDNHTRKPDPEQHTGETPVPHGSTPTAVLLGAALTLGLPAFIIMLFHAVFETVSRTVSFSWQSTLRASVWPAGLRDLAALAVALLLVRLITGERRAITALFWLCVFAGLWEALRPPAFENRPVGGVIQSVATRWTDRLMVSSAMTVGLFTAAGWALQHRRRVRAWPAELWKLTSPLPEWPGFRYSAGVVSVAVLILGCIHVVLPETAAGAFVAGASMLALANRRWEENLADVGLALITLGVVSAVSIWRPAPQSQSEYFVEVFNRVLVGLAVMTAFWHWLANVWVQQLDQGKPWTTAGRLIHTTRRVAYLVGAAGVLVAMHLALWPLLPYAETDDSARRWAWGVGGNVLMISALVYSAIQTAKPTLAWLGTLAATSAVAYVMTRTQGSALVQQWSRNWPLDLAAIAVILLLLAAAARRSRAWAPFWEPLYLCGLLVLPMSAITGASLIEQLHLGRWVPPATFACLAAVYTVAAWLPGPRGFLLVAAICAGVSLYMALF